MLQILICEFSFNRTFTNKNMARKKDPAKEPKVKIKVLSGKVTKAKASEIIPETISAKKLQVKLTRTPLGKLQRKVSSEESISATPFLSNCVSKFTSTPMITESKSKNNDLNKTSRSGRKIKPNLSYANLSTPSLKPLSPILADIGNLTKTRGKKVSKNKDSVAGVDGNENKKYVPSSPTRTASQQNNQKKNFSSTLRERRKDKIIPSGKSTNNVEENSTGTGTKGAIIRLKKRSIGIRKVAVSSEKSVDNKPLNLLSLTTSGRRKAFDMCSGSNDNKSEDNTLVKRLKADWSNETIEDTPTQTENPQKRNFRSAKRRLTPLIEITADESIVSPSKTHLTSKVVENKSKNNNDAYSSSAEFESEDEKENSRSKLAPTWKDLSKKTSKSVLQNSFTPKVRLRRSRLHLKTPVLASEENNVSIPGSIGTQKNAPVPSNITNFNQVANDSVLNSEAVDASEKEIEPKKLSEAETTRSPLRNLLNKSDLIEKMLSSSTNGDENIASNNNLSNSNSSRNLNNPNCTKKFFHSRIENTITEPKTAEAAKGRRTSARRKKQDSIYEFLSQSSSDTADPVADVIQKMIDSGKVTVAKHKKGRGKPTIKRMAAAKKVVAKSKDVFVKPKPLATKPQPMQEKVVNTVHFDDDLHFDNDGPDFFEEGPNRDQRGFSNLARSAMIKQAGKSENTSQRKMITDRKKLLEMARTIVGQSPSVRIPLASTSPAQLSPIPGSTSPWRVDDEKLPNLFYFSRNSDNLPSFSSDYIPSTPTKNKSKSKSSFSSNDSNMENIAPASVHAATGENHTQTSFNTRRALSYRSPLKPINIIEVINLPPLAMDKAPKETNEENTQRNKSGLNKASKTSLFGFEDMIEDDDEDFVDVTLDQSAISNKQHLKMKLQRLKRLRPEKPVTTTTKNNRIKPVFDERPKQRTLQEMLCSTMIERQRQSELANDGGNYDSYFNDGSDADMSNLFKDPEPETTFDETASRRTYSRPFRKKRKLRNNFVFFMDSDVSDDEDAEKVDKNHKMKMKKRQKKDQKDDVELNKFANEFNEMCKEVSQYELIVE